MNFKYFLKNRFCFREVYLPTYYNLKKYLQEAGWKNTSYLWLASFSDKNFEFDIKTAQQLEFKHLLADLVHEYCRQVMTETYTINDENWSIVLNEIADKYYYENSRLVDQINDLVWILKPSFQNNGKNIKILEKLSQIEEHYLSSARLAGEHVLQRYIIKPHLLDVHKYSIRMFVILTNYAGNYIYPFGYFNKALRSYSPKEFSNLSANITNEHLIEDEANVVQIPSQLIDFFPSLYPQIKNIITQVLIALNSKYPDSFVCNEHRALAIFGFDFMVDTDMRVWLLEANHGPCFPITEEHPLQKILYYEFWQAVIKSFVLPISCGTLKENIMYHPFERAGMSHK